MLFHELRGWHAEKDKEQLRTFLLSLKSIIKQTKLIFHSISSLFIIALRKLYYDVGDKSIKEDKKGAAYKQVFCWISSDVLEPLRALSLINDYSAKMQRGAHLNRIALQINGAQLCRRSRCYWSWRPELPSPPWPKSRTGIPLTTNKVTWSCAKKSFMGSVSEKQTKTSAAEPPDTNDMIKDWQNKLKKHWIRYQTVHQQNQRLLYFFVLMTLSVGHVWLAISWWKYMLIT